MNDRPYSLLARLQREVASACAKLPRSFASLAEFEDYRARLRAALEALLPVAPFPAPGGEGELARVETRGIEIKYLAIAMDDARAAALLYKPAGAEGKLPAVLVCPGYGQRKQDIQVADICLALAARGMIAIAPDYGGIGDAANRPDIATDINNHAAAATLLGKSDLGLRVEVNRALIGYLRGRGDVDAARIGITGLCQGSIVAWYTLATTDGIAAAALLCGLTTYEAIACEYMNREGGWSGTSPYLQGVLKYGDAQHILACFAPRPLLVINNITDRHWPLSGFGKARALLENVWALYGAPAPEFMLLNCEHAFAEPQNSLIADFLWRQLTKEDCDDIA